MANKILVSMVIALMVFGQPVVMASAGSLSELTNSGKPIKVFVKGFTNESGAAEVNPEDFKKAFEKALLNRKSVTFRIVPNASESDVQISGVLKKYLYSKTDPVTSYSPSGLVLDAVTTENYVEMTIGFTVTDAKSGQVLWSDTIKSFVKRMMTPEASVPLIYEKISRDFLWKSFGKPNR